MRSLIKLKKEKEVVGIYLSAHPLDAFAHEMRFFATMPLQHLSDLNPFMKKELAVGGIVNEVEHLESRNGKGWARFILEDFSDQYEFRIFGEDYLKFKHFLNENNFVCIKMFVKEGWKNRESGRIGDPRIQYLSFHQLQDSLSSNAKRIIVKLDAHLLEKNHIKFFKDIFKKHKGDQEIIFNVLGNGDGLRLNLSSSKKKVMISEKLLKTLKQNKFDFILN